MTLPLQAMRCTLHRITHERMDVQQKVRRRQSMRRMWSVDNLPLPRVFMHGPRWRSTFGVKEVPIATLDPIAAEYHRPGRKLLVFSLEEDVRERVLVELRPGIVAEWTDPREV